MAFKWYFFSMSSIGVYTEFCPLFMKQLGLSSRQIGITNLFGLENILISLLLLVADRYRSRYLLLWIVSSLSVICCLLTTLPILVSLPTCFKDQATRRSNDSSKFTEVWFHAQSVSLIFMVIKFKLLSCVCSYA